MGALQAALETLLSTVGIVSHGRLAFPRLHDLKRANLLDVTDEVYRDLGGILPTFLINLRKWDMEFDGAALELDEVLHFNRYRAITLKSRAYTKLPGFPLDSYKKFCSEFEGDCLRAGSYGGKWSNSSCESQFGPAGAPGALEGSGAPRWKQRAFYDFVKDLSPLAIDVKVVRVSVHDRIKDGTVTRSVAELLIRPSRTSAESIVELMRTRVA